MIGETQAIVAGLTTAVTAYSIADQMGTPFTFTDVGSIPGGEIILAGVHVTDDSGVLGAFDLVLFNGAVPAPSGGDNAAMAITVAENLRVRAIASFVAANLVNTGGRVAGNWIPAGGGQPIKLADTTASLHGVLVARSANAVFAGGATSVRVTLQLDRR